MLLKSIKKSIHKDIHVRKSVQNLWNEQLSRGGSGGTMREDRLQRRQRLDYKNVFISGLGTIS